MVRKINKNAMRLKRHSAFVARSPALLSVPV